MSTATMEDKIQDLLIELDKRADRAAKRKDGHRFATVLRVVVTEVRMELGLKEPRPNKD